MRTELTVLASGSRGNCAWLRRGRLSVLIDAGISARRIVALLREAGGDPAGLAAVLVTHEHGDHVAGLRTLTRRFDVPLVANAATRRALAPLVGPQARWQEFETGDAIDLGGLLIRSFPVPHDAAEPVGFLVESDEGRIGYATDLGHVPDDVSDALADCDALVFEANHDREMLREGPYPWITKRRVSSEVGHLSNEHAAAELARIVTTRTRTIVLAHLSQTNNDPALACSEVEAALAGAGQGDVAVRAARQRAPLAPIVL